MGLLNKSHTLKKSRMEPIFISEVDSALFDETGVDRRVTDY